MDPLCREYLATGTRSGKYQRKVEGWGRAIFGEIFDGYVPNLMKLWCIRNSSHWYGEGMLKSEICVLYARKESEMMSRANLISILG